MATQGGTAAAPSLEDADAARIADAVGSAAHSVADALELDEALAARNALDEPFESYCGTSFDTVGAALEQPLATLQDIFSEWPGLLSRLLELLEPQLKKHLLPPVRATSEPLGRSAHWIRHGRAASEPSAFSFNTHSACETIPVPFPERPMRAQTSACALLALSSSTT